MSYVIYIDGMLVWNTIINFAVICIATRILGRSFKLKRIILFSLVTALITTFEYILTIYLDKYIHHIAYATIYLLMIGIYFNEKSIQGIFHQYIIVIFSMLIINGGLSLFNSLYVKEQNKSIFIVLSIVLVTLTILLYSKTINQPKENLYQIILKINNSKISLTGFMDTGNNLVDPYTGFPVIILDYRVLKKLITPKAYGYILNYHSSGNFDYEHIKEVCDIDFYPLPYKTINTNFALMPAFKINFLTFEELNYQMEKIVCGISRFKLKNNNEYQVLLNESLKPNREEKFK